MADFQKEEGDALIPIVNSYTDLVIGAQLNQPISALVVIKVLLGIALGEASTQCFLPFFAEYSLFCG